MLRRAAIAGTALVLLVAGCGSPSKVSSSPPSTTPKVVSTTTSLASGTTTTPTSGTTTTPTTVAQTTTVPPTTALPTTTAVPLLGQTWGPDQSGYGAVEPALIDNGGDPTGVVAGVSWLSWGGAQAIGHGTSEYVAPDEDVADGTEATATIEAFNLGNCNGKVAYDAIEWWFPEYGQTFDPNQYINICSGAYVGQ